MLYKRVSVPLYHQTLHIIICDDVEKELKEINKKFYIDVDKFEFSGYAKAEGKHHLILLNQKNLPDEPFAVSTIAHEAFHVTSFIMKRVGIHPDVNNDEAQAYLLSWIVEQVYKLFKKK